MTHVPGAAAPTPAQPALRRHTVPIELLPVISSFGGGASYPTSFVGDSEPSVGISDPGAALRLAARVRGIDSAEFVLNGTGKGRRRPHPRTPHQQSTQAQRPVPGEHARTRERTRDDVDRNEHLDALSPIGLL